jgi:hypothetical protein
VEETVGAVDTMVDAQVAVATAAAVAVDATSSMVE